MNIFLPADQKIKLVWPKYMQGGDLHTMGGGDLGVFAIHDGFINSGELN